MAVPEDQFGGYEQDFVGDVPDRYLCSTICTKVLRDPHLTSCCGQHICESCLHNWFTKHRKPSCPHCRAEGVGFNHFLDKKLKREVLELKIRCSSNFNLKVRGCEWTGELENLEKHLKSENGCGFVEVGCSNKKCKENMLRKDLKQHIEMSCDYRLVMCSFCLEKGTYINITEVHMPVCINYPLPCPNISCGTIGIQRKDMPAHREQCPLEPIECPFAEAGCSVEMVRKELDKHLTDNQQQHLLKLMGAYKETKKELGTAELIIEKLQSTKDLVTIDGQHIQHNEPDFSEADVEAIHAQLMSKRSNQITEAGREHGILFCIHNQRTWQSPDFYIYGRKMHFETCKSGSPKILMASEKPIECQIQNVCVEITDCASREVELYCFKTLKEGHTISTFTIFKKSTTKNLEILEEYRICKVYVTSNIFNEF